MTALRQTGSCNVETIMYEQLKCSENEKEDDDDNGCLADAERIGYGT